MTPDREETFSAEELSDQINKWLYLGKLVVFIPGNIPCDVMVADLPTMIDILKQRLTLETTPTEGRKPS